MANEKRLISLDEALKATHSEIYWTESQQAAVRSFLVKQPKVDAVEVVHARWENGHCTNCTHYAEVQNIGFTCTGELKVNYKHTNYCPHCGAKMEGERKDNERKAD